MRSVVVLCALFALALATELPAKGAVGYLGDKIVQATGSGYVEAIADLQTGVKVTSQGSGCDRGSTDPWCYVQRATVRLDPRSTRSTVRDEDLLALMGDPQHLHWVFVDKHYFSCMDSRQTEEVLATPGGDLAEFILALTVYEELTNNRLSPEEVSEILIDFLGPHTKKNYFAHCSDTDALTLLQDDVGAVQLNLRNPPEELRNKILERVVVPQNIGDVHIRYMVEKPDEYYTRPQLVQATIQAFYELLWQNHHKIKLNVLHGNASAIAVVNVGTGSECFSCGLAPLVAPKTNQEEILVNHPDAVQLLREDLADFIARRCGAIDVVTLKHRMNVLGSLQLMSTVQRMANNLPFYTVTFD